MRRPSFGFQTRLTLTIAGAFIGAMLMILVLALFAAQNFDLAIVSTSFDTNSAPETPSTMATPSDHLPGASTESEAPDEPDEPDAPVPPDAPEPPDDFIVPGAIYMADEDGNQVQVVQLPEDRLPTLIRWSFVVLLVFAIMAAVIASWISRRSLARIAHITTLAQGLSEQHLDRRLNLSGPDDEIKQLGDTFDGMLDRLERGFTNQRLFVANASHELRTPLTTARAALEIPLAQGRVPPDLEPSLQRALEANRRSEELIAALILLAQGGMARSDHQYVNLEEITLSAIEARRPEANERGVTIRLQLTNVSVSGNATLLIHAVSNLVENAIRHNHRDGFMLIKLDAQPSGARLVVENTGAIYTPEAVARLTDPFHRHDASRLSGPATPGFGLGLAIVKSVAEIHRGALELSPREGGGIAATLTLPNEPGEDLSPRPE